MGVLTYIFGQDCGNVDMLDNSNKLLSCWSRYESSAIQESRNEGRVAAPNVCNGVEFEGSEQSSNVQVAESDVGGSK